MVETGYPAHVTARVPIIDWHSGFDRHWNGGDPPATHAFNALSFLFPDAERFFIEVVREVLPQVQLVRRNDLESAVKVFIAQESAHSQQHAQYNAVLEQQGYENVVATFVTALQRQSRERSSPLTRLAIVCAYEHFTAILGNFLLGRPQVLSSAPSAMALVWGWHSAEETEHKAVCFDLYQAAGGGWLRRVVAFLAATLYFNLMFSRLYVSMLKRDGCFHRKNLITTMAQSCRFFFGFSGVGWHLIRYGFHYLSPTFHPWRQDNRGKLRDWLDANRHNLRVVCIIRTESGSSGRAASARRSK